MAKNITFNLMFCRVLLQEEKNKTGKHCLLCPALFKGKMEESGSDTAVASQRSLGTLSLSWTSKWPFALTGAIKGHHEEDKDLVKIGGDERSAPSLAHLQAAFTATLQKLNKLNLLLEANQWESEVFTKSSKPCKCRSRFKQLSVLSALKRNILPISTHESFSFYILFV